MNLYKVKYDVEYNPKDYVFFWGGPFSQWLSSPFELGGIEYNCAEQYMMAEKARLFDDEDALETIMRTQNPAIQKATGRTVKNFEPLVWKENAKLAVYRANYAKFTQDDELYNYLLETRTKIIVEASPEDRIWGIGIDEYEAVRTPPLKWKGTNWLGEVIMKVRETLFDGDCA